MSFTSKLPATLKSDNADSDIHINTALEIVGTGLIIGLLGSCIPLLEIFIWVPTYGVFHEFGHTVVFWLGGAPAIPFYFITLAFQKSLLIKVVLSSLFVAGTFVASRNNRSSLRNLLLVVLVAQLLLSFFLSNHFLDQLVLISGLAGEAVLPVLVMILFFEPRVPLSRTNRIFICLCGFISLGHSLGEWTQVILKMRNVPHGSFLTGQESHGDINRLIAEFNWGGTQLTFLFFSLALLSLTAICFLLMLHLGKERSED